MSTLDPRLQQQVRAWMAADPDPLTVREAEALLQAGDRAGLDERFGAPLEFGTAGLRGLMGAGPGRMNEAVIRRTTWALCQQLEASLGPAEARRRGIVVGRDARIGSDRFAQVSAGVAAALGFHVHVYPDPQPTPLTAWAVGRTGAAAGVVVTASHNPPEYNGFKVFAGNGAQIVPPVDTEVAAWIDRAPGAASIAVMPPPEARRQGLWHDLGPDVLESYLHAIAGLDTGGPLATHLRIAYTPLHGVGAPLVTRALQRAGFTGLHTVASQEKPDGTFPTVRFPNPEEPGAMDAVLALAAQVGAHLVLANDPDADRLAVAYRTADGHYRMLTGNEIGVLLGHHRLMDDHGGGDDRLVVTTIVSSPQLGHIARAVGVRYAETLTGFKWIADAARRHPDARMLFGYEEALGSSTGGLIADKDGVSAALVCALLAARLLARGQTLGDRLDEISRTYGVYVSRQVSRTFAGVQGREALQGLMSDLRGRPVARIGETPVLRRRDYLTGRMLLAGGADEPLGPMPSSDVLAFDLEGDARVIVRPSGTEPKIKLYIDVREPVHDGEPLEHARARAGARLDTLDAAFRALLGLA